MILIVMKHNKRIIMKNIAYTLNGLMALWLVISDAKRAFVDLIILNISDIIALFIRVSSVRPSPACIS